jgi:hypothetical protein
MVLDAVVTPGNIHDSAVFEKLVKKVIDKHGKPKAVTADTGYKTPAIAQYLFTNDIKPALPYCTKSKDHKKLIQRHVWEDYLVEANHLVTPKKIKPSMQNEKKH